MLVARNLNTRSRQGLFLSKANGMPKREVRLGEMDYRVKATRREKLN
jgi:hypothetical protein